MAKQASLAKSETAKPAPSFHRTEAAPAAERPDAEKPVAAPPVATLVAPAPAEEPKRRGRPPGKSNGQGARRVKAVAQADILFMVETEAGSERYEMRPIKTVAEMFDLMDEERKLVATRDWREF
jgi:hypothetical protein